MGRSVEKSGRTVNDAIAAALGELELAIEDVHVDVLNEGKAGLFGLLSGKPARVRVTELDENERDSQPGYTGSAETGYVKTDAYPAGDADGDPDEDAESDDGSGLAGRHVGGSGAESGKDGESGYDGDGEGENGGGGDETGEDDYSDDGDLDYEYEINRAINYLGEIFKGINVVVDMEAEPTDEGFIIRVDSDDSGILIGHRGETLDSLQYLLNLYMNKGRSHYLRITVDVENYKKKREAALIRIAGQTADKVTRLRRNFTMDPMNSYERRIIHSTLQNHPKVETYSVGEEPNRKVVVTLKNRGGSQQR